MLNVWPPLTLDPDELRDLVRKLAPAAEGLGLEQVVVRARIPASDDRRIARNGGPHFKPVRSGLLITFRPADKLQPIRPLPEYDQKVVRMRQRGFVYPYEIIKMLTPTPDQTGRNFLAAILSNTISTRQDGWCPSIVPMVKTKPTSLLVSFATLQRSIPKAWRAYCCWEIRAKNSVPSQNRNAVVSSKL